MKEKTTVLVKCIQNDELIFIEMEAIIYKGLALHKTVGANSYTLHHIASGFPLTQCKSNAAKRLKWLHESAELMDFSQEDIFKYENRDVLLKIASFQ